MLTTTAKGAFPKDVLVRLSENETRSFIEDVMAEQQKFLQAADVVGMAVGDVVVVKLADMGAAGGEHARDVCADIH
jgi:hypothetical protein